MLKRSWSAEQKQLLCTYYPTALSLDQVAERVGKSKAQCNSQASYLKLHRDYLPIPDSGVRADPRVIHFTKGRSSTGGTVTYPHPGVLVHKSSF